MQSLLLKISMKRIIFGIFLIVFICASGFGKNQLKEPKYKSNRQPCIKIMLINGEKFNLIFDKSDPADKGYNILYADINLNNDLTDDKVIHADVKKSKNSIEYYFEVDLSSNGVTYAFSIVKKHFSKERLIKLNKRSAKRSRGRNRRRGPSRRDLLSYHFTARAKMSEENNEWMYTVEDIKIMPTNVSKARFARVFSYDKNTRIRIMAYTNRIFSKQLNVITKLTSRRGAKLLQPLIEKNGEAVTPTVQVVSKNGKLVYDRNIKQSCFGVCETAMRAPKKGEYKVQVVYKCGPLMGTLKAEKSVTVK